MLIMSSTLFIVTSGWLFMASPKGAIKYERLVLFLLSIMGLVSISMLIEMRVQI